MVREVRALGLETCATLGMVTPDQARELKDAGLDYYNHNLDTSPEFYGEIITTRTFQDRLDTLDAVRGAGLNVCCGGIVGMGETVRDRARMIETLANLPHHPESVPINQLVQVPGTPLAGAAPTDPLDFMRTIAVARVVLPKSYVRLSAGREAMSDELQALAFLAGANSIFYGEKLLTTGNPDVEHDRALLARLGIEAETQGRGRARRCSRRMRRSAVRRALAAALADLEVEMRCDGSGVTATPDGGASCCATADASSISAATITSASPSIPRLIAAMQARAARSGAGAGASHLVTGHGRRTCGAGTRTRGVHGTRTRVVVLDRLHGQPRCDQRAGRARRSGARRIGSTTHR